MPNLVTDIEAIAEINSQAERCHNDTKGFLKITEGMVKDYLTRVI